MTPPPQANVNFAVYTHWEDEAMKYNTNEFSGDALREAVTQFSSASPDTANNPEQLNPGRHAATGADEHQLNTPQPAHDDHSGDSGTPVDTTDEQSHPDYTYHSAPVTPAFPDTVTTAGDDTAADDEPAADGDAPESAHTALTPPAPVDIDTADGLLTTSHTDTHAAMPTPQTLEPAGYPSPPPAAATPTFPPPAPPIPAAYRPHPQQRPPQPDQPNWPPNTNPAAAPADLSAAMPTPPPWAEHSPPRPPEAPNYHPQTAPDPRTPPRPRQDWPTQQMPPVAQEFGYTAPQYDPYPPPRPTQDWQHPQQQPGWPTHQPPPQPHDPRQPDPNYYNPPAPQQDWRTATQRPHHSAPDTATPQRQPARPPLPTPPPPPNLGSEKTDHAFALQSQRKEGPTQGWRGALNRIHVPVRKSAAEQAYDQDIATINRTFRYSKTIGVAAFKGGVGKTTCALCLASTVAEHRTKGEVAALDTDDRGSLASRVRGEQTSDIKRFVADPDLQTPNEVKSHMMSNAHRLSVLGSSHSPLANGLQPAEYLRAQQILQNNHLFVFVDMDTSAASPAYETIMHSLDALVLVTSTSLDSAEAGRSMREWLRARDLHELAAHTLVLMNHQSPAKPFLDLESTASYYRNTEECPVLEVPWDEHLAEASAVSLDLLNKSTRRQFVKAAATLVDMLPAT